MPALDRREDEPVVRLRAALEFLCEEAQRLNLVKVSQAIGRVLLLLRKHSQSYPDTAEAAQDADAGQEQSPEADDDRPR